MRILSLFLSFILHCSILAACFFVSISPKVHVDLSKKVYNVVLLERPQKKESKPVVEKMVKPTPPPKQEKKKVEPVLKKPSGKAVPSPQAKKTISPHKKKQPKAQPKPEIDAAKREAEAREVLKKALGSAAQRVEDKKETEEEKVARELASLQTFTQGREVSGVGRATLVEIYSVQVKTAIKEHWRWPAFRNMRLEAQVLVRLAPDGHILERRLTKSSGRADFDSSVLRAIDDTKKLSAPPDRVSELELNFNAEELPE